MWDKIVLFKYIMSSQSQIWKNLSINPPVPSQYPFKTLLFHNLNAQPKCYVFFVLVENIR